MDAKLISLAINSNTENSDNNKNAGTISAADPRIEVEDLSALELGLVGGGDAIAALV